jgi:parallel beta-helix repeat protein
MKAQKLHTVLVAGLLLFLASSSAYSQVFTAKPGDDVAHLVQQSPAGSFFVLLPGVYRSLQIQPKDGDVFIGFGTSTVISGAALLTTFNQIEGHYAASYTVPQGQLNGFCLAQSPMCTYPEDLFFDNKPLVRVASEAQIGAGKWFLDYNRQLVLFNDNPSGHTVEISSARSAFSGLAQNVTIRSLVVEKYAVPAQMGAIGDQYPGPGWQILNCTVRWNHGTGIHVVDGGLVSGNFVFNNGQKGVGANGVNVVIQNNEISYNNYAGFDPAWEAGGSKFALTTNLVVRSNNVHDNTGAGLWTDIENTNALYDSNTVTNNTGEGIKHEISYSAVIKNNTVSGNGAGGSAWLWGSQILVQNSSNVEVANNTVSLAATYGNGIGVINQNRGLDSHGNPYLAQNNYIHDNDVSYGQNSQAMSGIVADYDPSAAFNGTNRFVNDHYYAPQGSWHWAYLGPQNWAGFQANGQDVNGTIDTLAD